MTLPRSPAPLLPPILIAGTLFIASLALYLSTLAPSVVSLFDDSLEFQLVTYQLGIAHPTGYPLYTLLGKLFTFLPVGDVAYRVNLLSAFFGAATVALLYLLIVRLAAPTKGVQTEVWSPQWPVHLGGVIGALLLAASPVFWQQATIAEVYTLNAFFVVTLLWVAVTPPGLPLLRDHLKSSSTSLADVGGIGMLPSFFKQGLRGMGGVAFLFGLSLTHHRTMLLLLPALLLYGYLNQRPGFFKRPDFYKTVLLSLFWGMTPLLLYLYLPLRGHVGSLDGAYENTWNGFWRQVSAGGYGVFIFDNPLGLGRDVAFYWNLFQSQFYTILPGLIGLFFLFWRGQRRLLILTGTACLSYLVFNLFYNVSDIEVFFIPAFLIWAAWSGLGVGFVLSLIATRDRGQRAIGPLSRLSRLPALLATGLVVAICAFIVFHHFQANLPVLSTRNTWQVHDYGLDMLRQPLPANAAIVGILGEMTLLRYFQHTENRRADIETVAADLEADRLATVERLLAAGRTVYLTRELPGAPERWSLGAVGPLIQVRPEPATTPPNFSLALNRPLTSEITLLGYDLSRPAHTGAGPPPLRLTLFWQATAPLRRSLKVSARLLNPGGETVAAVDAVPVHFAYPTTAWRPGEIIPDVYDLALPPDAPPGSYTPLIIWYDPAQNAAEVGRIELSAVTIE